MLFFVLGGALVGLHHLVREEPPVLRRQTEIVVTDADVAWVAQVFEKTWQRAPTAEELDRLVERRVRDEILFREARALGLDAADGTLRKRLALKLEFLAKDAAAREPTEADLRAAFEADPARYTPPAARTFAHVYINAEQREAGADAEAKRLLALLRADPGQDLGQLGDRIMLEIEHVRQTQRDAAALFGERFAAALFQQPAGTWVGPLHSGYGLHLVFVREDVPGVVPPFEAVAARVRDDVLQAQRTRGFDAYLELLRSKYEVRIEAEGWRGAGR